MMKYDKYGETDAFVFTDVNTVVNTYHYRALVLIANIAEVLGNEADYNYFSERAAKLKRNFNKQFFDKKRGVYVDGVGNDHASLHANMFPMAFGLVEKKNVDKALNFICSRAMACSVYGSQFLLNGITNLNLFRTGIMRGAQHLLTLFLEN
ncbi:MAG: trehalase family glycosidase [Fermentimonas sp.]|nr:trehalase family glycosidase [Fermentimonas sp.]